MSPGMSDQLTAICKSCGHTVRISLEPTLSELPLPPFRVKSPVVPLCFMAGALGFEPRQADPESAVLPLHYAPAKRRSGQ